MPFLVTQYIRSPASDVTTRRLNAHHSDTTSPASAMIITDIIITHLARNDAAVFVKHSSHFLLGEHLHPQHAVVQPLRDHAPSYNGSKGLEWEINASLAA